MNVLSDAARSRGLSPGQVALVLALLLGLQPVATDLYLPALPQLTRELGTTLAVAQQTMAALLLAFGLAQLVWGPVADRFGRRPVLLAGLAMYTLAAAAGAAAADAAALVAWRALQGVGLAAAVVCARALLRDLYEPHEGAQVMALGLSGLGVLAVASPALGGLVAAAAGWRAALAVVATVGAAVLAWIAWRLPETVPVRRADALLPRVLASQWWRIARHPGFRAWTLLVAASYGGLFTMLAGSSFVYIDVLGLGQTAYGAVMATAAAAYIAGTLACRRWVARLGAFGAVRRAAGITLAGGASMLLAALAGIESAWAVALPMLLYSFGHGVHQPCGTTGAVAPFPAQAGAASALAGFVLAGTAFGVGVWLGRALDGRVLPLAAGIAFWSVATALLATTLVQRQR